MRMTPGSGRSLIAVGLAIAGASAVRSQDEPPKGSHWKEAASGYRISVDAAQPLPLKLREEPALKWTNPQRRTDDGAVFVWLDRGRPEVAASFFRYKADDGRHEDHEFVSLSASPLLGRREGSIVWAPKAGDATPRPIPDAPRPAAGAPERLRQMRALAREFRANFNNPPDLSEIRLLTQPIYRFETEGARPDVLDGALFAFVHATDPEVLLIVEARPEAGGGPVAWHFAAARMSMVNLKLHHKDREVWSADWDNDLTNTSKPYMVRSQPEAP